MINPIILGTLDCPRSHVTEALLEYLHTFERLGSCGQRDLRRLTEVSVRRALRFERRPERGEAGLARSLSVSGIRRWDQPRGLPMEHAESLAAVVVCAGASKFI